MSIYGSRAKAAFNSLGMRPLKVLEGEEGSIRLNKVVEELREDDEVETVLEPFVRKYFDVLDDKEMIEYEDSAGVYDSGDKLIRKNGCTDEEIQRFVGSFDNDY